MDEQQAKGQTKEWRKKILEKLLHLTKTLKEKYELNLDDERKREKTPVQAGDANGRTVKKIKEKSERKRKSRVKRNTRWFGFFGGEEEEEEEEEKEKDKHVLVSSGNRALPSPNSPRAEVVDYGKFIEVRHST